MFLHLTGNDTNVTDAPWHVGIYLYTVQVCGGTIVSKRVVITAAHCFALNTDTHYRNLKVVAGKYKRGLDEEETLETQIRDVLEVKISKR